MMLARSTHAADYGADLDIATRDELLALAAAGELDDETLEAVLQLREAPLAPDASEEALAQLPGVSRAAARGLSSGRLSLEGWTQLRPYLGGERPRQQVELMGAIADAVRPGAMLRVRTRPFDAVAMGALLTARPRTRIRESGHTMVTTGATQELGLERFHVAYHGARVSLVAGSFVCAFADGLTLNTASQLYAARLRAADTVGTNLPRTPLRPVPALRGLGLTVVVAQAAPVRVLATVVGSYRALDLYQYGEWLHAGASPRLVDAEGTSVRYATIADAARETLGAAALELESRALTAGLFAYAARLSLRDPAGTLSPSSRYPESGRYGAFGARLRARVGVLTLRAETARTLTGGLAGVGRLELLPSDWFELSVGVRFYGRDYDNPYTRSFSEPDEVQGARARDERGVDVQLAFSPVEWLRLAAWADIWARAVSTLGERPGMRARANALVQVSDDEALALEVQWTNQATVTCDVEDPPSSCSGASRVVGGGERLSVAARVSTTRIAHTRLVLSERSVIARASRNDLGSPERLHRVMAHVTVHWSTWLASSLIAAQRLTPRTSNLSDVERMVSASFVLTASEHLKLEASARRTTRGLADGPVHDTVGLAELTASF